MSIIRLIHINIDPTEPWTGSPRQLFGRNETQSM
jgi:hypothetical protein